MPKTRLLYSKLSWERENFKQQKKEKIMNIQKEISILREILQDSVLTPAQRVELRAEIAQLEAIATS